MKRRQYLYHVLCSAILFLGSCSDSEDLGMMPANPGDAIRFSAAIPQTRTHYSDRLQINWMKDDEIGICSPSDNVLPSVEGEPKNATYKVTALNADGHPHHAEIEASVQGTYLKWGNDLNTSAVFYGAYPADRIDSYPTSEDGLFKMKYITNQVCTVTSSDNGEYRTEPDMKNAYMIAKNELQPIGDHVLLSFDPIMTTPDITITAGSYEVGTGIIQPVTVTGVSILMPKALTGKTLNYKINEVTNGAIENLRGELQDYTTGEEEKWESVFVQIDNGGKRYVDLYEGESINLMAFLPPIPDLTGAKIRVHTLGATDFVKTINNPLQPQSKIKIQLPDITPETTKPNNWISKLDGSTLLKEMSIPAYVCKGTETSDDIKKLLKKGVRAFELSDNILGSYETTGLLVKEKHYFVKKEYCEVFNDFLSSEVDKNKDNKEFVIIWAGENQDLTTGPDNNSSYLTNPITSATSSSLVSSLQNGVVLMNKIYKDPFMGKKDPFMGKEEYYFYNQNDERLCDYVTISETLNFYSNDDWKVQFIDLDKGGNNKAIYDQIVTYKEQSGCTGIVTIPNADKSFDSSYGDLLLQAVIDCNFKLRRNSKSNQQ